MHFSLFYFIFTLQMLLQERIYLPRCFQCLLTILFYRCQNIFNLFLIDGHLHCFLCVHNCNNAVGNVLEDIFLQACANISAGQTPKMELHFKFDGHCQIVLQNCSNSHSHQMCESAHFSTLFAALNIVLLNFCKHNRQKV